VRAGTLVGGAVVLLAMALVLPAAHSAPAKAIAGE
jgi:hypothetical protein